MSTRIQPALFEYFCFGKCVSILGNAIIYLTWRQGNQGGQPEKMKKSFPPCCLFDAGDSVMRYQTHPFVCKKHLKGKFHAVWRFALDKLSAAV
jgi:hypothetical protein